MVGAAPEPELLDDAPPLEAVAELVESEELVLVADPELEPLVPVPVAADPKENVAVAVLARPCCPVRVKYRLTAVSLGAWSELTVAPVVGGDRVTPTALKYPAKSVVGVAAAVDDR